MVHRFLLSQARHIIQTGGVLAYPTEAVFGLGCHPADECAVNRILELKQRDWRKGLILIAADRAQLAPWVELTDQAMQRIGSSWPGPATWILPASAQTPEWITGGRDEVAVRVTAHPLAAALARCAGTALVSTSANPAHRPPARSALAVQRYFGHQIDGTVHGWVDHRAQPTQICHALTGAVLRR
ncbi:MAG TPA: Sua5/YciO/YrdC/YwlC family protein [Halothiobacillus sp.]|nr:Sua5/YciO/YrdC/YwlC family protein [Halothiobacillus sp.]